MPKIIADLRGQLIAEAEKQIEQNGYSAVTIRSIAKGCGVGVGTVYNYFPSKDVLIATHMLEDWKACISTITDVAATAETPRPAMMCIYDQLNGFARRHAVIFHDEAAASGFSGSFSKYHGTLRDQLAQPLRRFCCDDFTAQFIAESLLTWTMAGMPFDEIYEILKKLL